MGFVIAGAYAVSATGAFFSDTETSAGNVFAAGSLDLTVDSTSHYDGLICVPNLQDVALVAGHHWIDDPADPGTTIRPDLIGAPCDGTWSPTDLGPTNKFFNISDIKPGDDGEDTISLHTTNDAWICANITTTANDDNTHLLAETLAGDTTIGPIGEGELAQNTFVFGWRDEGATPGFQNTLTPGSDLTEGDNIWQATEPVLFEPTALNAIGGNGITVPFADSQHLPAIVASTTNYVGLAWCTGKMDTSVAGTITCDGSGVGNEVQTDSATANVTLTATQSRNNSTFTCGGSTSGTLVGSNFSLRTIPVPQTCDVTVDAVAAEDATHSHTIAGGITKSSAGQNVCVVPGTYNESVNLNKGITLASTGGPGVTTITGGVDVNADNAIVSGFKVTPAAIGVGPTIASFFVEDAANNATITDNDIDGTGVSNGGGTRGIILAEGGTFSNVLIQNNNIHNFTSAIYNSTISGAGDPVLIKWNDIEVDNPADNGAGGAAGIGQLNDAVVTLNQFTSEVAAGEAIGAGPDYEATNLITFNNFLNGSRVNDYAAPGLIHAENNFWNLGGVNQTTPAEVDFTPEAGVQYGHR
jgi:hypothetical protein